MRKYVKTLCVTAFCLAWIMGMFSWLVFVPARSQEYMPHASTYYPSEPSYVLEMNASEALFGDSMDIEITFSLTGNVQGYNVTLDFYFDFERDLVGREAAINYTYICNGQIVRQIRHSTSEGKCRTYGGYDKKPIDLSALKTGENKIILRVSISSWSVDKQPKNGYFRLEVKDFLVDVDFVDKDGDGLLDVIDPMLGSNNYATATTFSILGMPIIGYVGLILGRRLEK